MTTLSLADWNQVGRLGAAGLTLPLWLIACAALVGRSRVAVAAHSVSESLLG